ncbi:MAG: hypothetical protein WCI50_13305 [Actinomycetes bacterium]
MAASTSTDSPVATPPGSPRRRVVEHPGRLLLLVVAFIVLVNLAVVLLRNTDTTSTTASGLPTSIESISPGNGEIVRTTDTITVDLNDLDTGVLIIDRAEIPEDQVERVVPLGQISFRPGTGKDLEEFSPGVHTVTVLSWPQGKPRPDHPASYTWTFKATA